MRFSFAVSIALAVHIVSAHYIFKPLVAGHKISTRAVRQPKDNSPVLEYASGTDIICNSHPSAARETVQIAAGNKIGFRLDIPIYHMGPAAIYLGHAPRKVADWDGRGRRWFKIAEWGATFDPFSFTSLNRKVLTTFVPRTTPSGEYLVRVEHIGLHQPGAPEIFISCAQIRIVNGGSGDPPKVSIPGYIPLGDHSVNLDIYWPIPTNYSVPGPAVWKG
ncbi:hypothetical protein AGABI2DRAFT_188473 [Agaricus bisporus var. bisporus H97]|uniref:hypothetical protein n=1 Tax=Agaricus bisporus var. bisporus (strain H97 / ATCC MYA-4626 / FGSC 10389) TaxID=936046 RepID=UPI00029F6C16|nr:hypothetical protein AGABI2DRAFT_188473 [Agaricus bisporus var. bisporus H97]EKV42891.1 hypothetical protein AGABI2DRAFT_188473 [Agaricus bisporus var. bisporus H97]